MSITRNYPPSHDRKVRLAEKHRQLPGEPFCISDKHRLRSIPFDIVLLRKLIQFFKSYNIFFLIILFSSCEKVINLDITNAEKQIVIEANISNNPLEIPQVKISTTKNFNEDNSFIGLSGATVSIQINGGTVYSLYESAGGIYQTFAFKGTSGSIYKLDVIIDGKTYSSESKMPEPVLLNNITTGQLTFGASKSIIIYPTYTDPSGEVNSYRLINYINGVQEKVIYIQNDDLSDGEVMTRPLINQESKIKSGDIVTTELQCITKPVYTYWYSLQQSATGNNQSATPSNPLSNINGGVLGYFGAYTYSRKTITIR